MLKVTLGRTGLQVNKNGFGALPLQRVDGAAATAILRRAYEGGVRFFDTARVYSDSEEKIGAALRDVRGELVLATKTMAKTADEFWADLHTSLAKLQTDYIDVYQFHTPAFCPRPGDGSGLYEAMLAAQAQGKIRYIGITNHRLPVAREAAESGLYDTLQFPFSYLSGPKDKELVALCGRSNVGFIAMKAMAGGAITDGAAAYAWMAGFAGVLPIWGIQRREELEQFLAAAQAPEGLSAAQQEKINRDVEQLAGQFCRGCGYCMPCPEGIRISNAARMGLMLRRAPEQDWLSEEWQENMKKIPNCRHCGLCAARCPYELDPPALLQANYEDYLTFLQ